jgi:hypothetical protein
LLVIYQVTGAERARLLHLVERQDEPGRWILDSPLGPTPLARLEAEATSLVSAHPLLVPGLAQTTDYAYAVMKSEDVPAEYVESRVARRLERQAIVAKDRLPKFDMIVDEIALRRVIGSHKVMARQLRALLDFADRPNVRLWVVPFERSADAGFHWPFYTIGFPRGESVVQLESKESSVYIEDQKKIEIFHRHAAKLGKAALDSARSADLVATIAKEYERE